VNPVGVLTLAALPRPSFSTAVAMRRMRSPACGVPSDACVIVMVPVDDVAVVVDRTVGPV
jgi:hypothetical protein